MGPRHVRRSLVLSAVVLCLAGFPARVSGQALGTEFLVNTDTTGSHGYPSVAVTPTGAFVVAWSSTVGDPSGGIRVRRYASDGRALGSDFQVNTYTRRTQNEASVGIAPDGSFIVVWRSDGSPGTDTGGHSIQGQRYASDGARAGSQFQVNTFTTSEQTYPAVGVGASGDFVVVWNSMRGHGPDNLWSIQGQRYASDGTPLGGQFLVNTYTPDWQMFPAIAVEPDGDFVVAWASNGDGSLGGVRARRFASDGTGSGPDFQVNTFTRGKQDSPSLAVNASGAFVIAWHSYRLGSDYLTNEDVRARRFASDGSALGSDFHVSSTTTDHPAPVVAMEDDGDFVISWNNRDSLVAAFRAGRVDAIRYSSDGAPRGRAFQVNTSSTKTQTLGHMASTPSGHFVIVWRSRETSAARSDIVGRRMMPVGITLSDEVVTEQHAGNVSVQVVATLSEPSASSITVQYATRDLTAVAGQDYETASGTLSFPPGVTSTTFDVQVHGDVLDEPEEAFAIALHGAVGASPSDEERPVRITDDDDPPQLFISNVIVSEGDSGFVPADFAVSLSAASGLPVTVSWADVPGTASGSADYRVQSGTLSFTPGETRKLLTVRAWGDLDYEAEERYAVVLSSPANATIADGSGEGIIRDNDPQPSVSISDVTVTESDSGWVAADFTISLTATSFEPVTVQWATRDVSATGGLDYRVQSGSVTFEPGRRNRLITVRVFGDLIAEGQEQFGVTLQTAVGASIADEAAVATINDNE